MFKKSLILTLGLVFILATAVMAVDQQKTTRLGELEPVAPRVTRADCVMAKHAGVAYVITGGGFTGLQFVTHFNPEVHCPSPAYPLEIQSLTFGLYDNGGIWPFPVQIDAVVYDVVGGDSCNGPGAELCRESVTADAATFGYPNEGTITFSDPCCVNGPFFIGVEYTDQGAGPFPSPLFDDTLNAPDTCDAWGYITSWTEWYNFWSAPAPGYSAFTVDAETPPNNCEEPPEWENHKMHFPQLPDEEGWDVNATYPVVLADDWTCSETGWVKDIHFWGSWKEGLEGVIQSFVLSIHANIPGPPSQPGPVLWMQEVAPPPPVPFDPPTLQGWYDPSTGFHIYPDHQAYFRYDIILPEPTWFSQDSGVVYWLNVSAVVIPPHQWGWKSTQNHYLDDAVWGLGGVPPWTPMFEPPEFTETLDLAFVITGEPPDEDIPTLNEWGMIILALLLLAAGTIAIVRRRKAVTSKA